MGITRRKIRKRISNKLSRNLEKNYRTRRRKSKDNFKTSKIKLKFDGDKFNGHGNWVSASSSQLYISYRGPKSSGRIYAPPRHYKKVNFDDKNNKFSGVWRGKWWDEDKKTEKMMDKHFQIQFGKKNEYEKLKNFF